MNRVNRHWYHGKLVTDTEKDYQFGKPVVQWNMFDYNYIKPILRWELTWSIVSDMIWLILDLDAQYFVQNLFPTFSV